VPVLPAGSRLGERSPTASELQACDARGRPGAVLGNVPSGQAFEETVPSCSTRNPTAIRGKVWSSSRLSGSGGLATGSRDPGARCPGWGEGRGVALPPLVRAAHPRQGPVRPDTLHDHLDGERAPPAPPRSLTLACLHPGPVRGILELVLAHRALRGNIIRDGPHHGTSQPAGAVRSVLLPPRRSEGGGRLVSPGPSQPRRQGPLRGTVSRDANDIFHEWTRT